MKFSISFIKNVLFFAVVIILTSTASCKIQKNKASQINTKIWTRIPPDSIQLNKDSLPKNFSVFFINETLLLDSISRFNSDSLILLNFPKPDGSFLLYQLKEVQTMSQALAIKYPYIKTYAGDAVKNRLNKVRIELVKTQLNAYFYSNNYQYYISNIGPSEKHWYIVYYKQDSRVPKIQFEESEKN